MSKDLSVLSLGYRFSPSSLIVGCNGNWLNDNKDVYFQVALKFTLASWSMELKSTSLESGRKCSMQQLNIMAQTVK